ncbi:MAG: hypothetical protein KDN20_09575 [Verrucomicrobiae bacterium]|nr:hypothetical protein [Verrucomicrobiae bacterium]
MDEALLLCADQPVLRFYAWQKPEITLGFFTPTSTISGRQEPLTRRWTGGGVVEHGEDLTFSLSVPRRFLASATSAGDRYRQIHEALALALRDHGLPQAIAAPSLATTDHSDSPGFCFAEPVAWDVIDTASGEKLAGGAQRRSRAGLLHQGSVRLPPALRTMDHEWTSTFASLLTGRGDRIESISAPSPENLAYADQLKRERYSCADWNGRF